MSSNDATSLLGVEQPAQPSSPRTLPRTLTGKRPTAASLQRQREYFEWLQTQTQTDDTSCSWATFMAERRAGKERVRLQQVSERRRGERWRHRHGSSPPPKEELRKAVELDFEAYRVMLGRKRLKPKGADG